MDIYNSHILRTQYHTDLTGGISAYVEYAIFDEMSGMEQGIIFPMLKQFFKIYLNKGVFGSKDVFVKLALKNPSALDQNIFRFINELKFIAERILSANIAEAGPYVMCSKVEILNLCSGLLIRQQSYGDSKVPEILTGILKMALNELSKLKHCEHITLETIEAEDIVGFYYMGRLYPRLILPASEEFYKLTIEILSCTSASLHITKVKILDMFVTFAENYPEKIREIGEKEFEQRLRRGGRITLEEHLIHGIFITISNARKMEKDLWIQCYDDFRNILENASNLERLARIIGGNKVWNCIENYFYVAHSKIMESGWKGWRFKYAYLIIISSLGDVCRLQIQNSIGRVMSLLKSISCKDSNIALRLTTCHTIAQLCIDISSEYFTKWQNEFFITTLLRYIQRSDELSYERITIDKTYALRALDICSKNCLTPSLIKHLPKVLDGILTILKNYDDGEYFFTFENVIEAAIKTFCTVSSTAKDYISKEHRNQFRNQMQNYLERYIEHSETEIEYNMHHMHYVIFDALLQMLKYENSPKSVKTAEELFEKLMCNNFLPFDTKSNDFEYGGGDFRTYTCPSVYILAKLSPEYLTQFAPSILAKIETIIKLARVDYLDIIKEYTLKKCQIEHEESQNCVTVEELLTGKIYACKAILNLAKCNYDILLLAGYQEVIDAMILNVSDPMYSMTQVTAAETLIVIMEILKENDEYLFYKLYRKILQCLMDAVRSQSDPMTLLQVLRQLIDLCKIKGSSAIDENMKIAIKDIYSSRTNCATEYVNSRIESAGSHIKSKSRVIAELANVIFENGVAASNTFINC